MLVLSVASLWLIGDAHQSGSNSLSSVFYIPASRFPFDEQQLRKMQQLHRSNKDMKQAHRNHTIVEIHDIEMNDDQMHHSNNNINIHDDDQEMPVEPKLQRPTTLNLTGH